MKGTWQTTDSGGGGLVLAVIAAVVLIGSGAGAAAASALASLLVTIAIVLGSVTGLAVLAGIVFLAVRARSERPRAPIGARAVSQLPLRPKPQLSPDHKAAIGPAREVHLHLNVSPDQLAAIVRHYTEEDQ
jgi:hypothetical protein